MASTSARSSSAPRSKPDDQHQRLPRRQVRRTSREPGHFQGAWVECIPSDLLIDTLINIADHKHAPPPGVIPACGKFASPPGTPAPVTVPTLTTASDHLLPFGEQMSSRASGWAIRTLSPKQVKKIPPVTRLAALILAARSSANSTTTGPGWPAPIPLTLTGPKPQGVRGLPASSLRSARRGGRGGRPQPAGPCGGPPKPSRTALCASCGDRLRAERAAGRTRDRRAT